MERRRAKFAPRRLLFTDNDDDAQTEQSNASVIIFLFSFFCV